jgi:hypothetical protein
MGALSVMSTTLTTTTSVSACGVSTKVKPALPSLSRMTWL